MQLPLPVYTRWGYDYWQQLPDGSIAVGGFRDTEEAAEWTHASEPTRAIQDRLEALLRGAIGTRAAVTHSWGASVAYTSTEGPDAGAPISEEVRPGVYVVGAYCGTGNVLGALYAREAAEWAMRTLKLGGGSAEEV